MAGDPRELEQTDPETYARAYRGTEPGALLDPEIVRNLRGQVPARKTHNALTLHSQRQLQIGRGLAQARNQIEGICNLPGFRLLPPGGCRPPAQGTLPTGLDTLPPALRAALQPLLDAGEGTFVPPPLLDAPGTLPPAARPEPATLETAASLDPATLHQPPSLREIHGAAATEVQRRNVLSVAAHIGESAALNESQQNSVSLAHCIVVLNMCYQGCVIIIPASTPNMNKRIINEGGSLGGSQLGGSLGDHR